MKTLLITALFAIAMPSLGYSNSNEAKCAEWMGKQSCADIERANPSLHHSCCTMNSEDKVDEGRAIIPKGLVKIKEALDNLERKNKETTYKGELANKIAKDFSRMVEQFNKQMEWIKCDDNNQTKHGRLTKLDCGSFPEISDITNSEEKFIKLNEQGATGHAGESPGDCVITPGSNSEFCDKSEYRKVIGNKVGPTLRLAGDPQNEVLDFSRGVAEAIGEVRRDSADSYPDSPPRGKTK